MEQSNKTRQLAAIMFSDIAGYTAMMQNDETDATVKRNHQRGVIEKYISVYNGKILQTFGDGTLCIFNSAVEAVTCAVDIQLELKNEPKVPLRIGIHIGDVTFDDNDIYGDGVNVASRIESVSVAWGVMVSDKVYDDLKNQPLLPAVSMGQFEFKNVNRPIGVYAISANGLTVPKPGEMKGKLKSKIETIAVLPFANMSADPENEYFSDGITEEILNALTKIKDLQVVARTSSFSFKGKNEDMREIGRKLNASFIIEGSVRKAGSRVRITVQLINTQDGIHHWSEVYDRELQDIFAVQDEISHTIACKFEQTPEELQEQKTFVETQTENIDAYDLFLKGSYLMTNTDDAKRMLEAIKCFEEVIKIDDTFLRAYTGLTTCYIMLGVWGLIHPDISYPKAKEYSEKALNLNKNSEETYICIANRQLLFEWDFEGAYKNIREAMRINPCFPSARAALYHYNKAVGEYEEGLVHAEKVAELDPLSIKAINDLAYAYIDAGKYEKAYSAFKKSLNLDPANSATMYGLAQFYIVTRDYHRAISEMEKWDEQYNAYFKEKTLLPIAYAKVGKYEMAHDFIRNIEQKMKTDKSRSYSIHLASMYCALRDFDNSFKYLEKAVDEKLGAVIMIKSFLPLRDLQTDSRFETILKKIGFTK